MPLTEPPTYRHDQDPDAEFYYALLLPDPQNEACHIMRRLGPGKDPELWAFTDSQDKAAAICEALNRYPALHEWWMDNTLAGRTGCP
jgi:hypothetical protein